MKKLLSVLLISCSSSLISQKPLHCGFLEANNYLFQQDPSAKKRFDAIIQQETEAPSQFKTNMVPIYTIPVVFHVLHTGGAENISDAQIADALFILNRDFNKENADTTNIVGAFQALAADCNIEFKLATLDENGNCTNGITRHYDPNTDWTLSAGSYNYTWNRTKYLNIYIVRSMPSGIAGYTYLPGTTGAAMDAVVILHNYVGSIGTGFAGGSRALTHEVGHWFNLQHVWGSTNQPGVACGDDGVGDTPVTKGYNFCNLSNAAQCNPPIIENVQNYMEYAFCSVMFTQGQRNRMHNCINSSNAGRINLWSPGNLAATGVFNSPGSCPPKADFSVSSSVTCVGGTAQFTDYSYNGAITNWLWSSTAASTTSTLQNGSLTFTNSGLAPIQLKVSNAFGSDSVIKNVQMVLPANGSGSVNLIQGFETGSFPDANWLTTLPQYGSPFQRDTLSAKSGSASIWVNNFYDTPNEIVRFFSPEFSFQSFSPAFLNFQYAYAQKTSSNNDVLTVFVSTNCGANWTQIFSKGGTSLNSIGTVSNSPFIASASDYTPVSINLSAFANQHLYIKFEFIPDPNSPGNNIFIDDINITGLSGLSNSGSASDDLYYYPNPFTNTFHLRAAENQTISFEYFQDALGRSIKTEAVFSQGEMFVTTVSEPEPGIYFLRIKVNNVTRIIKLIKE